MEGMEKLTAVEWLFEKVWITPVSQLPQILEQAKEMEKEQMIKFTNDWYNCYYMTHPMKTPEKYYNETFKSDEQE